MDSKELIKQLLVQLETIERIEKFLETECSDLCAPQSEQPYSVAEAVEFVVHTLRKQNLPC